jgi:hypothetical protein
MRKIEIEISEILDLVNCAEDYGFEDDVLFDAFAEFLGYKLSNEEIEIFSKSFLKEEGYGKEDYNQIKKRLFDFKTKYCKDIIEISNKTFEIINSNCRLNRNIKNCCIITNTMFKTCENCGQYKLNNNK